MPQSESFYCASWLIGDSKKEGPRLGNPHATSRGFEAAGDLANTGESSRLSAAYLPFQVVAYTLNIVLKFKLLATLQRCPAI